MQEKLKIFKIITVSAIILIVLLSAALIINLIKITKANAALSKNEALLAERMAEFDSNEEEIGYKQSEKYITYYARKELGMKGEGETAYTGNEK